MIALPAKTYRIIHDGDSIVYGYGIDRTLRYSLRLQAMLNQSRISTVAGGITGASIHEMTANFDSAGNPGEAGTILALPVISIIIASGLSNEIRAFQSDPATALASVAAYVALGRSRGALVYSMTCLPAVSFIAPNYPLPEELWRLQINAEMLRNPGGIYGDAIIDQATIPQLLNYADTNYYLDDQTHPTAAGHTLIAQRIFNHLQAAHIC